MNDDNDRARDVVDGQRSDIEIVQALCLEEGSPSIGVRLSFADESSDIDQSWGTVEARYIIGRSVGGNDMSQQYWKCRIRYY